MSTLLDFKCHSFIPYPSLQYSLQAVQLTGKTHLGITVDPKLKSQADAQVQHVLDRISKLRDLIKQCETNVLSPEEQAARSKEIDAIMEILKHKAGS